MVGFPFPAETFLYPDFELESFLKSFISTGFFDSSKVSWIVNQFDFCPETAGSSKT